MNERWLCKLWGDAHKGERSWLDVNLMLLGFFLLVEDSRATADAELLLGVTYEIHRAETNQ